MNRLALTVSSLILLSFMLFASNAEAYESRIHLYPELGGYLRLLGKVAEGGGSLMGFTPTEDYISEAFECGKPVSAKKAYEVFVEVTETIKGAGDYERLSDSDQRLFLSIEPTAKSQFRELLGGDKYWICKASREDHPWGYSFTQIRSEHYRFGWQLGWD